MYIFKSHQLYKYLAQSFTTNLQQLISIYIPSEGSEELQQQMSLNKYKTLCKKGGHQQRQVVMVCVNEECKDSRLCCVLCIDECHIKHDLISLCKLEEMLSTSKIKLEPDIKVAIQKSIHQLQNILLSKLQEKIDEFNIIVSKFQQQIKETISRLEQTVAFNLEPNQGQQLFNSFNNSRACQYLNLIKQASDFSFKDIENTAKTLKLAQDSFEKALTQFQKITMKGFEQMNRQIIKISQLSKSRSIVKKKYFSKIHKNGSIKVNEALNEAVRSEGVGGFPIVLIEQAINQANNSVNVLIKEQPGNKGVWIGVCLLNIAYNHYFGACYGIGKGTWAIDQVSVTHQSAFSWSHHDPSFNSAPKVGWQFRTGDIVTIKVNFAKSTVSFSKQNNTYEMPIKLDLGQLYFFVGVSHINDKICIV